RGHAGGADAVDVAHGQAGVGHGPLGRLHQDFHFGVAVGAAQAGMADAGHRHGAAQRVQVAHATSRATNTTSPASPWRRTSARTGMPMRTASGAMPSTRLIMRTPSSRSTSATL